MRMTNHLIWLRHCTGANINTIRQVNYGSGWGTLSNQPLKKKLKRCLLDLSTIDEVTLNINIPVTSYGKSIAVSKIL